MFKKLQKLQDTFPKGYQFESSTGTTKEFIEYAKLYRSAIKEQIETAGGKLEKFSRGHFCVDGFFTNYDGKSYYFSIADVRSEMDHERILYRECEQIGSHKNHGCNQYSELSNFNYNLLSF